MAFFEYGIAAFELIILEVITGSATGGRGIDEELLEFGERVYIEVFDSVRSGYNVNRGPTFEIERIHLYLFALRLVDLYSLYRTYG